MRSIGSFALEFGESFFVYIPFFQNRKDSFRSKPGPHQLAEDTRRLFLISVLRLLQAFAAEMCERITAGSSADSGERLPSNFDLVQTRTLEEVDCARSTLTRTQRSRGVCP